MEIGSKRSPEPEGPGRKPKIEWNITEDFILSNRI